MNNPVSLTHVHIANCIGSILAKTEVAPGSTLRILDAGCGNGLLMSYLVQYFSSQWPDFDVEFFGFDLSDHGVQESGFFEGTLENLRSVDTSTDWSSRLSLLVADADWPYADSFFDFVVSNQVLEHVHDKTAFFRNVSRCLKDGGYSFHLAPLRHIVHEGHIWLPFSHRIRSHELLYSYIEHCSRLGLGKYPHAKKETGVSVEEYSRRHADYMLFWTAYASQSETLDFAVQAGLRADFRFTRNFYQLKLRQILGWRLPQRYAYNQSSVVNFFLIRLLRYVSSVTLSLRKKNEY